MILKPPSQRVQDIIGWALIAALSPVLVPAIVICIALLATVQAKRHLFGPYDEWSPWFAWHPIRLGTWGDVVWLETVERTSCGVLHATHFRPVNANPPESAENDAGASHE